MLLLPSPRCARRARSQRRRRCPSAHLQTARPVYLARRRGVVIFRSGRSSALLLDALTQRAGAFIVDVAATSSSAVCPTRRHIVADRTGLSVYSESDAASNPFTTRRQLSRIHAASGHSSDAFSQQRSTTHAAQPLPPPRSTSGSISTPRCVSFS